MFDSENSDAEIGVVVIDSGEELYELALDYLTGEGVEQSNKQAIHFCRQAYEKGDVRAATMLGYFYENGIEVEPDIQKATEFYRIAASNGEMKAEYNLGVLLADEGQFGEAFEFFRRSAEKGFSYAIFSLGNAFANGRGVEQNVGKALRFYSEAAALGISEGLVRLAFHYRDGWGVEKDLLKAARLLMEACQQAHPIAWYELGRLIESEEIPSSEVKHSSLQCYERAAELGYPPAQAWYGERCAMGVNCEQDLEKGIPWLQLAMDAGSHRAKYVMAVLLATGQGVEKDPARAASLCEEAAISGDVNAQHMLGLLHERGNGVRRDLERAAKWFELAARSGHPGAVVKLSQLSDQNVYPH